jgi:hypothetical protein
MQGRILEGSTVAAATPDFFDDCVDLWSKISTS